MATITASGLGSTLDVNGIVSQLMAIERQPVKKLDLREAGYQSRLSAYGTLKGGIAALRDATRTLIAATNLQTVKDTPPDAPLPASSAAGVTVARDTSSLKSGLEAFVKAYNEVAKPLHDLSVYDVASGKAAVLQSDTAVRAIQGQMRNTIAASQASSGFSGSFKSLSQIGVAFQKDGSLAIDATKLQSAIDSSAVDVASIVATTGGKLKTLLDSQLSASGPLASKTDGVNLSIKLLNTQRTKLNARLADTEQRYRKQYAALDALLGSMKATSDSLTQQLAGLSSNSNSSNG